MMLAGAFILGALAYIVIAFLAAVWPVGRK